MVRQLNESNLILPAGDVKIGPFDYNLYSNSQASTPNAINAMPLKTVGQSSVMVADVGKAMDAQADSDQHRARGRTAVGVPADSEAGRRYQHDRGGGRN